MSSIDSSARATSQTSRKALASLVLGLLSAFVPVLLGVAAVCLGIFGLRDIGRSAGALRGRRLAYTGIVAGVVGTLCGLVAYPLGYLGVAYLDREKDRANREHAKQNLSRIADALLAYERAHGEFPAPAIRGRDGRPLLSWRVAVLPYLGDDEKALYQEFRLDEPWDGPHNRALLGRMPDVYCHPIQNHADEPSSTHYQVFVGRDGDSAHPIFCTGRRPVSLEMVHNADGASWTFLVAEARTAVIWTKPEDLPYATNRPLPALGGLFPDGCYIAMADGSVNFVRNGASDEGMHALITYDEGKSFSHAVIPPD